MKINTQIRKVGQFSEAKKYYKKMTNSELPPLQFNWERFPNPELRDVNYVIYSYLCYVTQETISYKSSSPGCRPTRSGVKKTEHLFLF